MNKLISGKIAMAMIVAVALLAGVLIWQGSQQVVLTTENNQASCQTHYYEGEARIKAWMVSQESDGGMVVEIASTDVAKLPVETSSKAKLIDAPQQLKDSLEQATSASPADLTIKGYASVCDASVPLVSLEPATKAFKKS